MVVTNGKCRQNWLIDLTIVQFILLHATIFYYILLYSNFHLIYSRIHWAFIVTVAALAKRRFFGFPNLLSSFSLV